MDYITQFSDFKPEELVGKYVLYESGMSYHSILSQGIRRIVKVTKTGFRISKNDSLFDFNGRQKGLNGRSDMGTISVCNLLTEEEARVIVKEWKEKKERRELIEKIKVDMENWTLEKVKKVLELE